MNYVVTEGSNYKTDSRASIDVEYVEILIYQVTRNRWFLR